MALYTRVLGWSPEEVQVFLAKVRDDMKSNRIHAYYKLLVFDSQSRGIGLDNHL